MTDEILEYRTQIRPLKHRRVSLASLGRAREAGQLVDVTLTARFVGFDDEVLLAVEARRAFLSSPFAYRWPADEERLADLLSILHESLRRALGRRINHPRSGWTVRVRVEWERADLTLVVSRYVYPHGITSIVCKLDETAGGTGAENLTITPDLHPEKFSVGAEIQRRPTS